LRENGGHWQGTFGAENFVADSEAIKNLLLLGTQLPLTRVISETDTENYFATPRLTSQFFDFGGAPIAGLTVAQDGEGEAVRFLAQVAGRPQVLEIPAPAGLALTQAPPFLAYRSRLLLNVNVADIVRLRREIKGKTPAVYELTGSMAQYRQTVPEMRALPEKENWEFLALLQKLAQLQCDGFLVAKDEGELIYGLDHPAAEIILSLKVDGAEREIVLRLGRELDLELDPAAPKFFTATISDNNYAFVLKSDLVRRLLANY
jgi:hypothetical protein